MKTWHYRHGAVAKSTLTVGELIAKLAQYPRDMPVLAEWEGQRMPFGSSFTTLVENCSLESERCECLIVDAEQDCD